MHHNEGYDDKDTQDYNIEVSMFTFGKRKK